MDEPTSDAVFILNPECKMRTISHPFEFIKFRDVFIPGFAKQLKKDMLSLNFEPTSSDLFSFIQTKNLINLDSTPTINLFIEALLGNIADMLSHHFNIEFNEKVTVSGSIYNKGDFLLCHDDASDDRAVAFIFYLTEEPWHKAWGGSLDLFQTIDSEVIHGLKSIFPRFNSLICFKVDPNVTYHQVSEVTADVQRLTINGWFHSNMFKHEPKIMHEPKLELSKHIQFYSIGAHSYLTEFINHSFFEESVMNNVQHEFDKTDMIVASDFLRTCSLEIITEDLENNTIWKMQGPPYKKKYDVASITTLPTSLRTLVHFLTSLEWFNYFEGITGLNKYHILNSTFEIQRWQPGYYTLLYYSSDPDFEVMDIIDVFIFINQSAPCDNNSNIIVYSSSSSDHISEDDTFQLPLLHNHIFVIRRKSTCSWFIRYLKKQSKSKFYLFQMSYCLNRKCSRGRKLG